MSYRVPAGTTEIELVVRKSRFIARIQAVNNRAEVDAALAKARADYSDARHHCWAYLFGKPEDASSAGASDDGEPAGTAGKPILNVLQHGEFGDVMVIVIRYFGGIKLGAGGLVRAYSAAAAKLLDVAPGNRLLQLQAFRVEGGFSAEQMLRHWLSTVDGELLEAVYGERVVLKVAIESSESESLAAFCGANQLQFTALDEAVIRSQSADCG